jgi:hypothetical protein
VTKKKLKEEEEEEEVPNGTSLPKINYVKYKIEIAILLTKMLTLLLFFCFNSSDAVK